jgi:hypothetical protein
MPTRRPARSKAKTLRARAPVDKTAADELDLYLENESDLYPKKQAIIANLQKKKKKGKYDAKKAPKLWLYLVNDAAKKYEKEFGSGGSKIFNKPTREAVAEELAGRYENGEG